MAKARGGGAKRKRDATTNYDEDDDRGTERAGAIGTSRPSVARALVLAHDKSMTSMPVRCGFLCEAFQAAGPAAVSAAIANPRAACDLEAVVFVPARNDATLTRYVHTLHTAVTAAATSVPSTWPALAATAVDVAAADAQNPWHATGADTPDAVSPEEAEQRDIIAVLGIEYDVRVDGEQCPKCGAFGVKVTTNQTRRADEAETADVRRTCGCVY